MTWPSKSEILEMRKHIRTKENKNIPALKKDSKNWIRTSWENRLSYEVAWLGVPVIQLPEDLMLMQELIFTVKPDVIIETGVAHGGSLIFYSSLLELLGKGKVIGVDIEIRSHNRETIEKHPMSKRIILVEGDSVAEKTIKTVEKSIDRDSTVLLCLDSNHTKEHVLKELKTYNKFVTPGSYIVVFDTIMPELKGLIGAPDDCDINNPLEAIKEFLVSNNNFEIDDGFSKFYVSYCPSGFLRRK